MKKVCLLFLVLLCSVFNSAKANDIKIHAIVFCNTNDEKIGESCKNDQERFAEELGFIETAIGCEEDWQVFIGDDCTKPNLEKVISNLNCSPNDVVFFYYSGHGVHAEADPKDGWLPQMCLKYESYDQDKFVPVTYVRERLSAKGARLNIILTDCCNNEANWVTVKSVISQQKDAPNVDAVDIAKLKKLFFESRGTVIATTSKRGQVSYGPEDGGCFSVAFWDEMYRIEQGAGVADWKTLIEATSKRTLQYTNNKQEPAYQINVNNVVNNNINNNNINNNNNNIVVISAGEKELGEAFKQIVNPNYSRNERWNMISGIVGRLFDSNALVLMVGRDLKTNVGRPVNINKYLEELALSKRVKGINIVRTQKSNTGKFNQIVVSEIRETRYE